jgi:transcriptional regulator with XRE-family HTH domain
MVKRGERITVQYNLFTLKKQLEIAKQRSYSWSELAERSGLNRKTVERIAQNKYQRADFATLEALLEFFHEEGMPVGIQDLLTVTFEERGQET